MKKTVKNESAARIYSKKYTVKNFGKKERGKKKKRNRMTTMRRIQETR